MRWRRRQYESVPEPRPPADLSSNTAAGQRVCARRGTRPGGIPPTAPACNGPPQRSEGRSPMTEHGLAQQPRRRSAPCARCRHRRDRAHCATLPIHLTRASNSPAHRCDCAWTPKGWPAFCTRTRWSGRSHPRCSFPRPRLPGRHGASRLRRPLPAPGLLADPWPAMKPDPCASTSMSVRSNCPTAESLARPHNTALPTDTRKPPRRPMMIATNG